MQKAPKHGNGTQTEQRRSSEQAECNRALMTEKCATLDVTSTSSDDVREPIDQQHNLQQQADMEQHSASEPASIQDAISNMLGLSLQEKLSFINTNKLAGNRPVYVSTPGGTNNSTLGPRPTTSASGTASSASSTSGQAQWVQPSGPRKPGQGTENEEQGIISAEFQPGGGVVLRVTLLAAGFIIGPAGASVREIMRVTGVDIKSWTDNASKSRLGSKRPCRVFVVDGDEEAVGNAVEIMTAAVDRYKELCEGRCQGQSVTRQQHVMGVEFSYQPPPRNVVPFAAALKGNITRPPPSKTGTDLLGRLAAPSSPLMPIPPGFLLPVPGTYLAPGSPGGALPFPMYMPTPTGTFSDLDLSSTTGSAMGAGAVDMYGAGLDPTGMSQLLGAGGQAAWPQMGTSPGGSLGVPYGYPTTAVDPASMMAYMSLMMPQSPGQHIPGMEGAGGLGVLPGFPGTTATGPGAPRMDSATSGGAGSGTGGGAGFGLGQGGSAYTSPSQPQYQTGQSGTQESGPYQGKQRSVSSPGGRTDFAPAGTPLTGSISGSGAMYSPSSSAMPAMGVMGPIPGGFAAMAPYGMWYPPSPHGVAYSAMPWGGMQQPGRGGMGQMGSQPGSHGSPGGGVPSPSRLNPRAQPYSSPTAHRGRAAHPGGQMMTGGGPHDHAPHGPSDLPPSTDLPGGESSKATASPGGAGHMLPTATAAPHAQQLPPGKEGQSSTVTLKIDDPVTKPASMAVGKTPKRPVTTTATGGRQQGDRGSTGSGSIGFSGPMSTVSTASGALRTGGLSTGGSSVGSGGPGGSTGGVYGGTGVLPGPATPRPLVSSEDPLATPPRRGNE